MSIDCPHCGKTTALNFHPLVASNVYSTLMGQRTVVRCQLCDELFIIRMLVKPVLDDRYGVSGSKSGESLPCQDAPGAPCYQEPNEAH